MSDDRKPLTADDVRRALAGFQHAANPAAQDDWPLRAAAAVLYAFNPAILQPLGTPPRDRDAAMRALLADCEISTDLPGHFVLRSSERRRALTALQGRDQMMRAIQANPPLTDDPISAVLQAWIRGDVRPLEQLSLFELTIALRVAGWVETLLDNVPKQRAVRRALAERRLTDGLMRLGGDRFTGRERELAHLRDFIGVLPGTSASVIARVVRAVRSSGPRRPLAIHGPGGVGKTALVAKLLIDNLRAPTDHRFPFVFLDLARPHLRTADAVGLLNEVLDQLRQRQAVGNPTIDSEAADPAAAGTQSRSDLIGDLRASVDQDQDRGQPFLAVLDSVEDLQLLGPRAMANLRAFIDALDEALASLARVVLIARIPIADFPTDSLAMNELDRASATAFLQARGVADAGVRDTVVARFGGNPLTLALAAQLVARGEDLTRVQPPTGVPFGQRSGEGVIQATLLDRILDHVADPIVRQLTPITATVRRITPAMIKTVLAPGAGLDPLDDSRAVDLFEQLAREVTVFKPVDYGTITMRNDLRLVLLPMIRRSAPQRVLAVDRLAVDYYAARDDVQSRAEEIYHRLSLGLDASTIDARWTPGVEPFLASAIEELGGDAQQYLAARLSISLSAPVPSP